MSRSRWPLTRALSAAGRAGLAAAIAVLVLCPVGCTEPEVEPVQIQIATGSRTGVYYVFGQSLATIINREVPGVRASVMVTTASAENLELVSNGSAQLGFTQADILPAVSGDRHPVSAVARVYDDLLHLVSRADGPIRQLEDLRGSRLSVGAPGSGTAITANRLLAVAQLAEGAVVTRQLGLDASVAALRTGEIDAFFFSGGLHVKAIEQLAADVPTRLVDLARWTEPLRRGYSEVYFARDIPSSVYGLDGISTVANPNFLIVGSSVPEALVYTLTRLLMDFRDELSAAHPAAGRLNRQSAIATLPLPLHPGAARYYRDTKP